MPKYIDIDGDSNVESYETTPTSMTVWFNKTSRPYTYSYEGGAGMEHVEKMKLLATHGDGLNAYINKHVKFKYDK
jgi:hypothetical protein